MNRTYLDVSIIFTIISTVVVVPYTIVFLVFGMYYSFSATSASVMLILPIFLLITGLNIYAIFRLIKAKKDDSLRSEIFGWSFYLLFTGFIIAGVFAMMASSSHAEYGSNSGIQSLEKRLHDLETLFEKGLISKEEYQNRRKRIIEDV